MVRHDRTIRRVRLLNTIVGYRIASTPETRQRCQILKSKRKGQTWEEDGQLYRTGPTVVTVPE